MFIFFLLSSLLFAFFLIYCLRSWMGKAYRCVVERRVRPGGEVQ